MNDWTRTKELLADALELQPERRTAFLERACGADEHPDLAAARLALERAATE